MPPYPSLPLRDGRLGAPSHADASRAHEPYYSNEDIYLLHEIVAEGEAIYPTLPERDRLPTNALFQAAEQILPLHGYDPDHAPPNISRLIFRVGGMRSEGSLMDKFQSVLKDVGIELEFVQHAEPDRPPSTIPASVRSSAGSADQTGTFPVSPFYNGRRRRNSDTAAPSVPEHRQHLPAPSANRARSVSPNASRYPTEELHSLRAALGAGQRSRWNPWVRDDETDALEDEETGNVFVQDLPIRVGRSPARNDQPFRHRPQDFEIERYPRSHDNFDVGLRQEEVDMADIEHEPRTPTEEGSNAFLGASDTTVHTWDDALPPNIVAGKKSVALGGEVQIFRNQWQRVELAGLLGAWRVFSHRAVLDRREDESVAARTDQEFVLSEAIAIWKENAMVAREERLLAAGPYLYPAMAARMERRADRAYSILLLHKAFTHWTACTRDEADRTAVARRHILRKRCFSAWRSQQSADESKVRYFRLKTVLRLWSRASIHHEVRTEVTIQKYHHDLAKAVFERWRAEYLARLADDLRTCRIKERCIATWRAESIKAIAIHGSCVVYDERLLLEDVVVTWQAEYEETRLFASGCTQQKKALDCQRILREWQIQASLKRLLSAYTEARNWRTKQCVVEIWASSARTSRQKALVAKKMVLEELITHWGNETKLQQFQGRTAAQHKARAMCKWMLKQKVVGFRRSSEARTKAEALSWLRTMSNKLNARSNRGQRFADSFAIRTVQSSSIDTWWDSLEIHRRQQDQAAALAFYKTTSQAFELWLTLKAEASARNSFYEERARSGAYYCRAVNTLSVWSATAAEANRERLTRTYHAAKRQYRVNLAAKCVSSWRKAVGDALAFGWYSDKIRASNNKAKLGKYTQQWNASSKRMQLFREVAAGAELEVWWGRWSAWASQLRETELDAAEYSSVQTLLRCWKSWDFSALQYKSRQNVVATLQEKHDQRLRRHILSMWSHAAGLEGTFRDPRSSSMSRRSLRHGSARQSSRFYQPETPRFGSSVNYPSSSQVQQLSYIPEVDERRTSEKRLPPSLQQYGRGSERLHEPYTPTSRDMYQSLPVHPARLSKQGGIVRTSTPQHFRPESNNPRQMSMYVETPLARGPYYSSMRGQPEETPQYEATPHPREYVTPRQFGPMSDFDDEEAGLDEQVPFSPGEASDLVIMSTPSRYVSSNTRQQEAHHTGRPMMTTTTTPSAPLSTPFERALREEYALAASSTRRSMMGASTGGRTGVKETPRVTFADIREESGEYGEEEGYVE